MNTRSIPRICSIEGCENKHRSRGWCEKHYSRWLQHGNPLTILDNREKSIIEIFEENVELIPFTTCYWWTGVVDKLGYGRISRKRQLAHRVSYELYIGEIPSHDSHHGMCVLHKCDNPSCVNPKHLFLGTNQDNIDDMVMKGRSCKGTANARSKLTETDIVEIRNLTLPQPQIANLYGVSQSTISSISCRKTWKHIL